MGEIADSMHPVEVIGLILLVSLLSLLLSIVLAVAVVQFLITLI